MWNGTQVRTIGGAFIPDNSKEMKWYHSLSQAYTLGTEYPEVASFVAWKRQYFTFSANVDQPDQRQADRVLVHDRRQRRSSGECDQRSGRHRRPRSDASGADAYSGPCTTGSNTNGKIRAMCAAVVDESASTITITAERIDGDNGAPRLPTPSTTERALRAPTTPTHRGLCPGSPENTGSRASPLRSRPRLATARRSAWRGFLHWCVQRHQRLHDDQHHHQSGIRRTTASETAWLALLTITADGGDWLTGNFDGRRMQALETAINDLLNGDGVAEVTWGTDWNIEIVGTHTVFTSASDDDPSTVNFATF